MDYAGYGPFQGAGVAFQCFMPTERQLTLDGADNTAFAMSNIPEEVDITDCIYIEDYCEHLQCICMADEDARFADDTNQCDGITNPRAVIAIGGSVGLTSGAAAAGLVGSGDGPWAAFWAGIAGIGGFTSGALISGTLVEAKLDRDCRTRANSRHNKYKNLIRNEFVRCRSSDPQIYNCPVPR